MGGKQQPLFSLCIESALKNTRIVQPQDFKPWRTNPPIAGLKIRFACCPFLGLSLKTSAGPGWICTKDGVCRTREGLVSRSSLQADCVWYFSGPASRPFCTWGCHQVATWGTEAAIVDLLLPSTALKQHFCFFIWRNKAALDPELWESDELTIIRLEMYLAVGSVSSHYIWYPLNPAFQGEK